MTLEYNNGKTKELDPKESFSILPILFGLLFGASLAFNMLQYYETTLLKQQIKALESLNELYKKPIKTPKLPQFDLRVKVTPKPVKPKEIVVIKKEIKPVYKEYKPLISNDKTLIAKSSENQEFINTQLNKDFDKIWFAEGERLIDNEKLLISELNSDLSILLNVVPEKTTIKKFVAAPTTPKTKRQKILDYAKKAAIPTALSILLKVVIP